MGCKSDLKEYAEVSVKEVIEFAKMVNFEFMECSAVRHCRCHRDGAEMIQAEGKNTDQPFLYIANAFHSRYEQTLEDLSNEL